MDSEGIRVLVHMCTMNSEGIRVLVHLCTMDSEGIKSTGPHVYNEQ